MAEIGKDFPQTREARRAKLQEIKDSGKIISTVKVPGRGVQNVYRIPLQYLSYNPYNTRFLAQARTLEKKLGRQLRDDDPEDVKQIEEFIWEEKEAKNNSTIDSLIKEGQLIPGVVTIEGVILSGNRRFRLLNEISRNKSKYESNRTNLDGLDYFEAAILDEELDQKGIIRYESFYQYGAEDKADYDPIQKYIAADTQRKLGFTTKEIADNFSNLTGGNPKEVEKWLEVYGLMEEYLDYIGEEGIYTALEGKEEAFLRLRLDYNSLKNGRGSNAATWAYDENDLADLKCRFFDYIRKDQPTHDFRIFKKAFRDEKDWHSFNNSVEQQLESVDSFQDYRDDFEDLTESELSKRRNRDYKDKNAAVINDIYGTINAKYINQELQETPLNISSQILQKVKKLSDELDRHEEYPEELIENVRQIQQEIGRIKQKID